MQHNCTISKIIHLQKPSLFNDELHQKTSGGRFKSRSKPPNPEEFAGGRKKFESILSQIRERQKLDNSTDEKNTNTFNTNSETAYKKELNDKTVTKRPHVKYKYPLHRKMRRNVNPINHRDKGGHNLDEMSQGINEIRKKEKTLYRQYSTMKDNIGASESIETSTHSKAVNTKSMSAINFKKGIEKH